MMVDQTLFAWKPNARVSVEAQVAGEEINRLQEQKGPFFKPADLVEAAKPKNAPLHNAFEWDNRVAAKAYREDQARYLIRMLVVSEVHGAETKPTRAFVSVQSDDGDYNYTDTHYALSQTELRLQVLGRALSEFTAFKQKYEGFVHLDSVMREFSKQLLRAQTQARAETAEAAD